MVGTNFPIGWLTIALLTCAHNQSKISAEKTLAHWNRVHLSLNQVVVWNAAWDSPLMPDGKGGYRNAYARHAEKLGIISQDLRTLGMKGVHPRLREWTFKLAALAEMTADMKHTLGARYWRMHKNVLKEVFLGATDELFSPETLERLGKGKDLQGAVGEGIAQRLADRKRAGKAIEEFIGMLVREKYELRAAISNDLDVDLPLTGDRCPVIYAIVKDGPAENAGLESGDIILSYNGVPLDTQTPDKPTLNELVSAGVLLASIKDVSTMKVTVIRRGQTIELSVPIGDLRLFTLHSPANAIPPWKLEGRVMPEFPYTSAEMLPASNFEISSR